MYERGRVLHTRGRSLHGHLKVRGRVRGVRIARPGAAGRDSIGSGLSLFVSLFINESSICTGH